MALGWWSWATGSEPPPSQNGQAPGRGRPPQTHEEWVARYNWLHDAYSFGPYSVGDMKEMGLFRALDPNGDVILETRRLVRDVQHVVDTGAMALWGPAPALDLQPGGRDDPADLDAGQRIWRRSRVQEQKERWAKWGASMGDVVWEAVRTSSTPPYGVRIVAYDPRFCEVEYDELSGTELERVIVRMPYFDAGPVDPQGGSTSLSVLHTYVRVLDADSVTVYRDGVIVPEESGPHGLGVVPAVHVSWLPYVDPAHGNWTAVGLESTAALVDSLLTQVQAIGGRHASPFLALIGARMSAGSDVYQFGRVIGNIPEGGDVKYVEATLQGVAQLLEAANLAASNARATLPEFLFSQAGASASGAALNFWAAAFTSKIESIRGRWSPALARVTEYAVRMENGAAYDPDDAVFRVLAPPPLPVNIAEEVKTLHEVRDHGGMLLVDYVRGLQRVGALGADVDPDAYAAELEAQTEAEHARTTAAMQATFGGGASPPAPPEPPDGVDSES